VNADGLCAIHSGRLDPVELGRRSAKARKAKREQQGKGSFRGALRELLERDPEVYAARLLDSGAKGLELADRFLAEEDAREKEGERVGTIHDAGGRPVTGLADVLAVAVEIGAADLVFGFTPTPEQVDAIERARDRWHEEGGGGEPARASESESAGVPFHSDTVIAPLHSEADDHPAVCEDNADTMPRADPREVPSSLGRTRTLVDRL